ncbi:hypothetical protein G6F40_016155 [Rhizopus arrhizus]|nr:hypothetical protein G6F40_016155 [Rhizopus arrhizus]
MARLLVEAARDGGAAPLDAVTRAVGEATQVLRFNQRLLEAALENMSQGISVVDAQLQLVAWNTRRAAGGQPHRLGTGAAEDRRGPR